MRKRAALLTCALVAGGALTAGCTVNESSGSVPTCRATSGADIDGLVLMAQSVPTASKIPCVRLRLPGWSEGPVDVRTGHGRFVLANDRAGSRALTVELTRACDVVGAIKVPTDQPGTTRWERVVTIASGYVGNRYYVYPGGCVTYRFRLHGETRAIPVSEATLSLGLVDRSVVAAALRDRSDDRLRLDP
jgi:hypothetical protein